MKPAIRFTLFGVGMLLALLALNGCLIDLGGGVTPAPGNELSVAVSPSSGYPPLDIAITGSGVTGGQYTFVVEGRTYTQGSSIKHVTILALPCDGQVVWEREGYAMQTVDFHVALENEGPIIGIPRLNGIDNLWWIHPRSRYIVDFPDAYDPNNGAVTLISVTVKASLKNVPDTVYCPPYEGPDVYHAKDGNGRLIENAFVFHSLWTGHIDLGSTWDLWVQTHSYMAGDRVQIKGFAYQCILKHTSTLKRKPGEGVKWETFWDKIGSVVGTGLPFSPPGKGESGYPGGPLCGAYDQTRRSAQTTTITAIFEDEQGATTVGVWVITTGPDPGCNIY